MLLMCTACGTPALCAARSARCTDLTLTSNDAAGSAVLAVLFALAAVSTCATVELWLRPGRVGLLIAYRVNTYLWLLPPGHGPKYCSVWLPVSMKTIA